MRACDIWSKMTPKSKKIRNIAMWNIIWVHSGIPQYLQVNCPMLYMYIRGAGDLSVQKRTSEIISLKINYCTVYICIHTLMWILTEYILKSKFASYLFLGLRKAIICPWKSLELELLKRKNCTKIVILLPADLVSWLWGSGTLKVNRRPIQG